MISNYMMKQPHRAMRGYATAPAASRLLPHPSDPLRVTVAALRLPCARKAHIPSLLPTANYFPTRAPEHARTDPDATTISLPSPVIK
jgi:hypothetical protein